MNFKGFKVIAAILVVVTITMLLPAIGAFGAKECVPELLGMKGTDFSDNSYIAGKLQELFDLLPYSDYPYFTTYGNKSCGNSICSYCNGKNVAKYHPNLKDLGINDNYDSWSCFGFARFAFLYIFGEKAYGMNYYGNTDSTGLRRVGRVASDTYDLNSIKGEYDEYTSSSLKKLLQSATPGDIIQARTRDSSGTGNHSMIFLKADDDGIYVLQNNMYKNRTDSNGDYFGYNRVMISYMTYTSFKATWNSIVTVYRADRDTYQKTWNKGNNICVEHSYTAEGGDYCVDCGYKFQRTVSTKEVGLYRLDYAANVRPQPYVDGTPITTLKKGTVVSVISAEVNSIGEKWYKIGDGEYMYDGNLSPVSNSSDMNMSLTSYPLGKLMLYYSFEIKGKVSSYDGDLEKITGMIISGSTGKVIQTVSVSPSSSNLDLGSSDVNYDLKFGQLSLGKYIFLLTAENEDGDYYSFVSTFEVISKISESDKVEQKAPTKPVLATKYDVYVILEYDDGYEYSMDKKKWTTTSLFNDLEPNTEYTFYRRLASTPSAKASPASPGLTVKTLKIQKAAEAPTLKEAPTDNKVVLKYVTDYEYSKDGVNWQSSNIFRGLSPATDYAFYQRDKDTKLASNGLLVRTSKTTLSAPEAPMIMGSSDTTVMVNVRAGYEYAIRDVENGGSIVWITSGEFTGLSPAKVYHVYCRIAETETTFASPISEYSEVVTDKSYPTEVPEKPVVIAKNSYSITLKAVPGVEFSLDGEHFTRSNVIKDLIPGTTYSVVCRYRETDTSYASFNSEEIYVDIIPDKITSREYKIDELNKFITEVPMGTSVGMLVSNLDYGKYTKVYDGSKAMGKLTSVSTGNKVVIDDEYGNRVEYTVIVKGDVNGDGIVTVTDMLGILCILNGEKPSKVTFTAADINSDGYVNAIDYAIIKWAVNNNETVSE